MSKKINSITFIIAMEEEASPIIEILKLKEDKKYVSQELPVKLYRGKYKNINVTLSVNGLDKKYNVDLIGPVPATLNATLACQIITPDIIVSCGTAGGFKANGSEIGSIYLSKEKCVFHDRNVPLPGFLESGIGYFPVLNTEGLSKSLGLDSGVISTGSSLKKNDEDLKMIRSENAVAKEMEAAAIAWVCSTFKIPFFAVKSITNILDAEELSEVQFGSNLYASVQSLTKAIVDILDFCNLKEIEDLALH